MHYMYKNWCSFPSFFSWHLNQQENIIAHFLHMYHKRFVSICEDIKDKRTNYQYWRKWNMMNFQYFETGHVASKHRDIPKTYTPYMQISTYFDMHFLAINYSNDLYVSL